MRWAICSAVRPSVAGSMGSTRAFISGSTARSVFGGDSGRTVPADMAIVGIIDTLEVNREKLDLK